MENILLIAVIFLVVGAGLTAFFGVYNYTTMEELKIPEDGLERDFLKETTPDISTGANPNRESMGTTPDNPTDTGS